VELNEEMENITSLFVANKINKSGTFWNTLNGYIETTCKEIHSRDEQILETCRFGMFLAANLFLINKAWEMMTSFECSTSTVHDDEKSEEEKAQITQVFYN